MTDWSERIGRHMTAEGSVIVPPRIAHWLEKKAGVTGDKRIALRDTAGLRGVSCSAHRGSKPRCTENGTKRVAGEPKQQESDQW